MQDITQLIFKNGLWLSLCLGLYYIISFTKVLLLVRIQAGLLNRNLSYGINIKGIFSLFASSIVNDHLIHKITINYLLSFDKAKWKLIGDKKVDFYYGIFDTISTVLKPYLIIATIWAILKFMIDNNLAYNELEITLSQIQLKLVYINSISYYKVIDDNKDWFFLSIVFMCAIIGILKKYEDYINNAKSFISLSFTIASTISSLTFFGVNLGDTVYNSSTKLKKLELDIKDIHENIYREVAQAVVYKDLKEVILEDIINNEKEVKRLDSLHSIAFNIVNRYEISQKLAQSIKNQRDSYFKETRFDIPEGVPPSPEQNNRYKFTRSIQGFDNNFGQDSIKKTSQDSYWRSSVNWNKGEGIRYTELTNEFVKNTLSDNAIKNSEMEMAVRAFCNVLIDKTISYLADAIGSPKLEVPKAFASFIVIDKIEEKLASKVISVLQMFSNKKVEYKNNTNIFFKKTGNSSERIKKIKEKHNYAYNNEVQRAIKEEATANYNDNIKREVERKIDDLVSRKVKSIITRPGSIDLAAYDEFTSVLAENYKNMIVTENLSSDKYKKLISSNKIIDKVFLEALVATPIRTHPGPIETCPICIYKTLRKIR